MSILGEPIGTCILAYYIFGEVVTTQQLMGVGTILVGIFLFLRYNTLPVKNEELELNQVSYE